MFLLVNVYRLSSAVLADRLMAGFDVSGAQLGTLHASFFYVYALLQLPAGVLVDRIGPRRTVTAGCLLLSLGAIGFAASTGFYTGFLTRALIGVGGSVVFVSIMRFCVSWYRADEYATMSGLTVAIVGLGGILAATPLAVATDAIGWRPVIFGLGLSGLCLSAGVYLFVRDDPPEPLYEDENEKSVPSTAKRQITYRKRVARVLAHPRTWLVGTILFCTTGTVTTLLGLWGVPFVVQTYDVSVTTASQYTLLGSVGLLVGPPAIGWLSDRLGRRTELLVAGSGAYILAFLVLASPGRQPLALVAVAYFSIGLLTGAFTLGYPVIKEQFSVQTSGLSTATVNCAGFTGAAAFPTLMGAALDAYWTGETVGGTRVYTDVGYQIAFAIAAVAALVALLCSVILHRTSDGGNPEPTRSSPAGSESE
ncbi:MFS transporter [Natronorubrum halalkaliphilum]|uniref:MFS transporter n=1 Tax=Natronorubrum halalkaliphilum TaxID=2691917 RepID=UPI002E2CCA68|nr:MFS transporter [Natronorubrum halalkaliphilum]